MNKYPYPVLTPYNTAYKNDIIFELECTKTMPGTDKLECELSYILLSDSIKKLIADSKADIYIKIKTSIISKMEKLQSERIIIDYNDIAEVDDIKLTLYVLARKGCVIESNEELDDIYGDEYSFQLRDNDVVAISNTEKLVYSLNGSDFIKFKTEDSRDGHGIRIDCNDNNYINIWVGKNFNEAYAKIKNDLELRNVINTNILFECFTYVLLEIIQNKSEHIEKEWFYLFEQMMNIIGTDVDEFVAKSKDGDTINLEYVYSVAQELMNNELEKSIIAISRKDS